MFDDIEKYGGVNKSDFIRFAIDQLIMEKKMSRQIRREAQKEATEAMNNE